MPATDHSVFTGRMPFLPPNQQRQSTEGITLFTTHNETTESATHVAIGRIYAMHKTWPKIQRNSSIYKLGF